MKTNEMNNEELNLNEMETANGAGVIEWVEKNIALPIYKKMKSGSEDMIGNIGNLKDMADDKLNEVFENVKEKVKPY